MPQSLGLLVCVPCLDDLNFQQKLLILPPDPQPFFNTRPENYAVDETNWLTTEDGDIIDTQDGEDFITSLPNPAYAADTSNFIAAFVTFADVTEITVAYLDIFSGDPEGSGQSVLALLTGSSTRTNVLPDLTYDSPNLVLLNLEPIELSAASLAVTNTNYAAIYDAATGGNLILSTQMSSHFTVNKGNPVRFNSLDLSIYLGSLENELLWGAEFLTWGAKLLLWGTDGVVVEEDDLGGSFGSYYWLGL